MGPTHSPQPHPFPIATELGAGRSHSPSVVRRAPPGLGGWTFGRPVWERSQGDGVGSGGPGDSAQPCANMEGVTLLPTRGLAGGCALPAPGSLLPVSQSHPFWCERGPLGSIPIFSASTREVKGKQHNKKPLRQPQTPKQSSRQRGRKEQEEPGRSFHQQRLLQESWTGTLHQQTQSPRRHVQGSSHCSGGSLQGSISNQGVVPASPRQDPALLDGLISGSSLGGPQPQHTQQLLGAGCLPVPPGFDMAVPGGWPQLCLSPNLRA